MIATESVKLMIKPWLTGCDEKDAKILKRMFKAVGLSISQWRQVVSECK